MENFEGEYQEGEIYIDYLNNTLSITKGLGYDIFKIEEGSAIEIKLSTYGVYGDWIPGKVISKEVKPNTEPGVNSIANGIRKGTEPRLQWYLEGPEEGIKLNSGMPVRIQKVI